MSPDMNPIEHVWDFIGRKINQRNPKCQNIDELRTVILQEWQQFPQERIRRLVRSMARRVTELHNNKNVQVQLTVKGKTTPESYTPTPKAVVPKMWLS
jgi:hypothetical protein